MLKKGEYVWYIEQNGKPVKLPDRMRKGTDYTCDKQPLERLLHQPGWSGEIKESTKQQRKLWRTDKTTLIMRGIDPDYVEQGDYSGKKPKQEPLELWSELES